MSGHDLMRQPEQLPSRRELRNLLQDYLQADEQTDTLEWETFTTENGPPHNWIYDLFADSQGNIWAGTWGGGLTSWSGERWHTLTRKDGLHCNEITCIREDAGGACSG